jgi:hypothetical protein
VGVAVTRGTTVTSAIGAVTQIGICGVWVSKALDRHVHSPLKSSVFGGCQHPDSRERAKKPSAQYLFFLKILN